MSFLQRLRGEEDRYKNGKRREDEDFIFGLRVGSRKIEIISSKMEFLLKSNLNLSPFYLWEFLFLNIILVGRKLVNFS